MQYGYVSPGNQPFDPGAIQSGAVASGDLGTDVVLSGSVGSGAIIGAAGGGSRNVASGTLTTNDIGSGAIVSGLIASGQIGGRHFASGAMITQAQWVASVYSGTPWSLVTAENVSGVRAVCVDQSGNIRVAMAAVSGRMPAVGVVIDNALSGIPANIYTDGLIFFTSGLFNGINHFGQPVWVGRSGQLSPISGSFDSGGYASGDIGQKLGVAVTQSGIANFLSGAVLLRMNTTNWSGGPLGEATGGVI